MNIVYCTDSYRYFGGIQRITIEKANALAEIPGYNVYLIVSDNKTGDISHPLSPKVHLIDLDINYYEDDWKSKFHFIRGLIVKRYKHRKRMKEVFNKIKPDIVIATGTSEKYFINAIKGSAKSIREIHFVSNYRDISSANSSLFNKIISKISTFIDFKFSINNYDLIALLTKEDKENNWRDNPKAIVMPNPITFSSAEVSSLTNKEIISVGRLSGQKNFSSLIQICSNVFKKHPDWHLTIWGDGNERKHLNELINKFKLGNHVFLPGSTTDVRSKLLNASIFAFSSNFEGFALALLEAAECGLPLVSYSCPSGPKDLITDGENGFLVPPGDEDLFAERLCQLIENEHLRKQLGEEAHRRAQEFALDKIIGRWQKVFEELIAK